MKYRVFNTEQEAIEAQNEIYRDFIKKDIKLHTCGHPPKQGIGGT